ncbi:MAG: MFS transporter [Ignavibacteria bacterium]|nr:MFS transporter [Ignavibacteria bacterium]
MVTGKEKFPASFWSANTVELFERAAHYALFISITLYLTNVVGFNDIQAAWISGFYSAGLYFLPPFSGAVADRIGFRMALLLAFTLLTIGYISLAILPVKSIVLPALILCMIGGSFIKSVITGTVAKTTSESNRARGYSIFYAIVNIGAFAGKSIAYPLRLQLGVEYINFFSAACTGTALIVVFFLYKSNNFATRKSSLRDVWNAFVRVLTNVRLFVLILIVTGFWMIQQQLYATMPKYIIRTVGKNASPEWIANINPFIVVVAVVFITRLMKHRSALSSITFGMLLMPVSALCMSLSPVLARFMGDSVQSSHFHPVTLALIAGIIFQALAECFISPRYLEYFSLQAPKGEEGLYLGFAQIHSFFASILGFGLSGYLLSAYCPDPATVPTAQLPFAYQHAHVIWYYFAAIGSTAAIALIIYGKIFNKRGQGDPLHR